MSWNLGCEVALEMFWNYVRPVCLCVPINPATTVPAAIRSWSLASTNLLTSAHRIPFCRGRSTTPFSLTAILNCHLSVSFQAQVSCYFTEWDTQLWALTAALLAPQTLCYLCWTYIKSPQKQSIGFQKHARARIHTLGIMSSNSKTLFTKLIIKKTLHSCRTNSK